MIVQYQTTASESYIMQFFLLILLKCYIHIQYVQLN